jgi:hypothetical protein
MATAVDKRMWLRDARAHVAAVLNCPLQSAEKLIVLWIIEHKLDWGVTGVDGHFRIPKGMTREEVVDTELRKLFSDPDAVRFDFDESYVFKTIATDFMEVVGFKAFGFWVDTEDLEVQLPPSPATVGVAVSPSSPKPGSAAAWINELWPNGEWQLMTAKQAQQAIERAAKTRGHNRWPSESSVERAFRRKRTLQS